MVKAIEAKGGELLKKVRIFDVYKGRILTKERKVLLFHCFLLLKPNSTDSEVDRESRLSLANLKVRSMQNSGNFKYGIYSLFMKLNILLLYFK